MTQFDQRLRNAEDLFSRGTKERDADPAALEQLLSLQVPSGAFRQENRDLVARIAQWKKKTEDLDRHLRLVETNRISVELADRDPAKEVSDTRKALNAAQNQTRLAIDERRELFATEKKILELKRGAIWAQVYRKFVREFETSIGQIFADLRKQLDTMNASICELFGNAVNDNSPFATMISQVDHGSTELTELAKEAGLGPQFALSPLRDNVCNAIVQALRRMPRAQLNELLNRMGGQPLLLPNEAAAKASINEAAAIRFAEKELAKRPSGIIHSGN